MTAARREALQLAQEAADGRNSMQVLASMDPNDGLWSWRSSPHVLWLAHVLEGKL